MYEDSGEGYGFKKGEKLVVNINAIEGKLRTAMSWYKIQVITDKLTYDSKCLSGDRLEVKVDK